MRTAVFVDVDGTLVDVRSARHHVMSKPKNFTKFHQESLSCPPIQQTLDYCDRAVAEGHRLIVVTARKEQWREGTLDWLHTHLRHPFEGPVMRDDSDNRPDIEVKADMHRWLSRVFDIVGAIDDNPHIVELWQGLNIPTEVVDGWDHKVAAAYVELSNTHDPVRTR